MMRFSNKKILVVSVLLVAAATLFIYSTRDPKIDFNTQVKPIFNKKCISCHGGVKRKAGFSLLFRSEAIAATESGKPAIIPGDPSNSELMRRIRANDPEERMPYKHEPLDDDEIEILHDWIEQGAEWGDHWAYLPVKKVPLPSVKSDWIKNDIDRFILEKINEQELKPSPEADKPVLLRRVSLDLTGILPAQPIAQNFLNAKNADAYESLIDSLLASPHYGERWASMWLDLARYADTKGYESDYGRNIWRYRDWVIDAFNKDMPYDRFLTEQIAGDLLPEATESQLIATAFHRNAMSNDEGGTDNEEFRTSAVIDRVNTTWEALMGTTFACVQCHSHPYDPFRHEEYYNFMAYFNNTRDEDIPNEYPWLREFTDSLREKLDKVVTWVKENDTDSSAKAIREFLLTWEPTIYSTLVDNITNNTIENNNYALMFRNRSQGRINNVHFDGSDQMLMRFASWVDGGKLRFNLDSINGPLLAKVSITKFQGNKIITLDYPVQHGVHNVFMTYENPTMKDPKSYGIMFDWFKFTRKFPGLGKPGHEEHKKIYHELVNAHIMGTPITLDNPAGSKRKTHVFERGNWMVKGKEVEPAVPNVFRYALPANAPANRMGLVMWMTNTKNPLVARTLVNRLWEQLFGTGIAETLEDMGTQGLPPTHQELLDHLSWKLMHEYNWSVKRLLKEIVTSATYRQSSKLTEETKKKDLFNKYYARGPRIRLSAEQIRDQHLGICGMMNEKLKGPSVMPWQPEGIWYSPYNSAKWTSATDSSRYRRALYTYWKRSSPYPSMIAFDGAPRNICAARRIRTNTPLQALVTLNDSVYLDMARHFAYRMKAAAASSPEKQISKGYEWMLFKPIAADKLNTFMTLYRRAYAEFRNDPAKTCDIIGIQNEHNDPQTAALVVVANAMMNLDEVVTKN
jgi:mono/diheme cytochrome c family protein